MIRTFRRSPQLLFVLSGFSLIFFALQFLPDLQTDRDGVAYPFWIWLWPLPFLLGELVLWARLRLQTDENGVRWRGVTGRFRSAKWTEIEVLRLYGPRRDAFSQLEFHTPQGRVCVPSADAKRFLAARLDAQNAPRAFAFASHSHRLREVLGIVFLLAVAAFLIWPKHTFFPLGASDTLFQLLSGFVLIPIVWLGVRSVRNWRRARATLGHHLLLTPTHLVWRGQNQSRTMQIGAICAFEATREGFSLRDNGQEWNFAARPESWLILFRELAKQRGDLENLRHYWPDDDREKIEWRNGAARFSYRGTQLLAMSLVLPICAALILVALLSSFLTAPDEEKQFEWIVAAIFVVGPLLLSALVYFGSNWWAIWVDDEGLIFERPLGKREKWLWRETVWEEKKPRFWIERNGQKREIGETQAPLFLRTLIRERAGQKENSPRNRSELR